MSSDIANAPRRAEPPPAGNHCAREQLSPGQPAQCQRLTQALGLGRDQRLISGPDFVDKQRGSDLPQATRHCVSGLPALQHPSGWEHWFGSSDIFSFPQGANATPSFFWLPFGDTDGCRGVAQRARVPSRLLPSTQLSRLLSFLAKCFPTPSAVSWPRCDPAASLPLSLHRVLCSLSVSNTATILESCCV